MADVNLNGRIRIRSDQSVDRALQNLQNLNGSVGELDRRLKGSANATSNSTKAFAKMSQGLGGLVQAYAFVAANVFAASSAFNTLRDAARVEQLTQSMQAFATATGVGASSIVKSLKQITDYALSTQDAMRITAQATASGFSGTQLKEIVKVASDASKVLGRDMGDSVDRLVRGVSKLEPELIDEIGLMTRVDEAARAYALSVGKSASSLTNFEKRMAFANAVIEEGRIKFGLLGDEVEANPFDKLAARFSELANKVLAPIADLGARIGSLILNNLETTIAAGVLVLINVIDGMMETVTRKMEQRLDRTNKEAARAKELITKISARELRTPEYKDISRQTIKASDIFGTNVKRLSAKPDFKEDPSFKAILEATATPAIDRIQTLKPIIKENKELIKIAKELKTLEDASTVQGQETIANLDEEIKRLREINKLAGQQIKLSAQELQQQQFIQNARQKYLDESKTYQRLLTQQAKETAGVDIARVTESFGIGGGLTEGFGRLKEFLSGTAYGEGATEEEKKTQDRINSMGKLEKATFAFSEGLGIVEQTFGKVFGLVTRFTNVIGVFITAYTLAKEGWKAFMETIGATSQALDEAKQSTEDLTKQIDELSKTQLFYDNLVKSGYVIEALKQRTETLKTLITTTTDSSSKYIKALQEMQDKEKEINEKGGTFADFIGEEIFGRRTAARKEAVADALKTQEKGINSLLSRLNTTQIQEFDKALQSALGPDFGYILDSSTKKISITAEEFNRLADNVGGTAEALSILGTAFQNASIAGVNSISELTTAFDEFKSASKTFKESTGKSRLQGISVTPERQQQIDAEAFKKGYDDVLDKIQQASKQGVLSQEELQGALTQTQNLITTTVETFRDVKLPEDQKTKLDASIASMQSSVDAGNKERQKQSLVASVNAAIAEYNSVAAEINDKFRGNITKTGASLGFGKDQIQIDLEGTSGKEADALIERRTRALSALNSQSEQLKGLGVQVDTTSIDTLGTSVKNFTPNVDVIKNSLNGVAQAGRNNNEVFNLLIDGTRTLADDTESLSLNVEKSTNALINLQNASDGSFKSLGKVAQGEVDVTIAKLAELNNKIKSNNILAEAAQPGEKAALTTEVNRLIEQRNSVLEENLRAAEKVNFYQELSTVDLTDTASLETKLLEIRNKYPRLFQEQANLLSFITEDLRLQNELQSKGVDFVKQKLEANIELRKSLQGDFFSSRASISEIKQLQALTRKQTLDPIDNEIASLQSQIKRLSTSTDPDASQEIALTKRRIENAQQERNNQSELLNIRERKETIDYFKEVIDQENKSILNFSNLNDASQQVWFEIGQTFTRDIEDSMGFVKGAANVFTNALDSTIDSFVDSVIEGSNILENTGKALKESLVQTLGDMAKDSLKAGVKTAVVATAEKVNPKLAEFLKDDTQKAAEAAQATRLATEATAAAQAATGDGNKSDTRTAVATEATSISQSEALAKFDTMITLLTKISECSCAIPSTGGAGVTDLIGSGVGDTLDKVIGNNSPIDISSKTVEDLIKDPSIITDTSTPKLDPKVISDQAEKQTGFLSGIFDKIGSLLGMTEQGNAQQAEGFGSLQGVLGNVFSSLLTQLGGKDRATKGMVGSTLMQVGMSTGNPYVMAAAAVTSLLGFEKGGVMTSAGSMPLNMYAKGGVANSPQIAMFGEGSRPEAYVPLPDGRSIPVTMQGTGGSVNNIGVTVNISKDGTATTKMEGGPTEEEKAVMLGKSISAAIKLEIANQQRPGGLLARRR